jgi:hypothetical protein
MSDSIFELGEQFGIASPFGNWLRPPGNSTAPGVGDELHVTRLKGPDAICAGAGYEYRIVGFNRTDFVLGEMVTKVKWGYSIDGKAITPIHPRAEGVVGKHEIRMKWRVPRSLEGEHLKMYAWFDGQDTKASTSAEVLAYPFMFHKYREKGRNEVNTAIADDVCYGDGVTRTDHFRYTRAEVESLGVAMQLTLSFSVQELWEQFRTMVASLFSIGELEPVALAMIARFEESSGAEFTHPVLTKYVLKHQSMIQFTKNVEEGIRRELTRSKGNPVGLLNSRTHFNSNDYGRPQFSSMEDTFSGGLRICWNDTWAYEVQVERFDMVSGSEYLLKYRIALFDHFGLNLEDLSEHDEIYLLAGFRAWFALQHIHNHRPFIATVVSSRSITGRIQ